MPLISILKNKLLLQKHYNCQEISMDTWPFWMFEENIKLVNQLIEEEEKQRRTEEEKQKTNIPNMNTSSMMSGMSSMANKFKR